MAQMPLSKNTCSTYSRNRRNATPCVSVPNPLEDFDPCDDSRVNMSAAGFFGVLLSCLLIVGCVLPSTRRAHEQHMVQAAAYKTEFDRLVPRGTSLPDVKEFLKAQDRRIVNELPDWGNRRGNRTGPP